MRRLILLRHAKSDWPDGASDIDRPLAPRGREAAPKIAAYLAAEGLIPDRVLVSPARARRRPGTSSGRPSGPSRTRPCRRSTRRRSRVLDVVRSIPDEVATALMIGHNPGFQTSPGCCRSPATRAAP